MIYESERITVKDAPHSAHKVIVIDNFAGMSMTLNKDAFLAMCKGVAEKDEGSKATA
jgi:hypothetical protein